ncbi:MAG TPA: TniQ family protein [Ancylobacter sp.]
MRRELPLAPRPEDDELLSSWQSRVACRYDLIHDDLSRWLGVLRDDRCGRFTERDFAPSAEMVQAWAAACRLPEERVQALALSSRPHRRSRNWYVWGEGTAAGAFRRPVCLVCLDEDAAAGRDHHIRRTWALVETVVCSRHHRVLEEACPRCLDSSGFRFVVHEMAARLACVRCGRVVRTAPQERSSGSTGLLAIVSALVATAIDDQYAVRDRMLNVARLLWKPPRPRTGRRTPFVADVVPDLRLTPTAQARVDPAEPLATAPIGWRMVTLLGVAALLDLGNSSMRGRLAFTLDQMVAWTEEPRPRPKERPAPMAASSCAKTPGRSDADYLALARSILASEEWRAVQGQDPRTQRRILNTLSNKALARRPEADAPAPSAVRLAAKHGAAQGPAHSDTRTA